MGVFYFRIGFYVKFLIWVLCIIFISNFIFVYDISLGFWFIMYDFIFLNIVLSRRKIFFCFFWLVGRVFFGRGRIFGKGSFLVINIIWVLFYLCGILFKINGIKSWVLVFIVCVYLIEYIEGIF